MAEVMVLANGVKASGSGVYLSDSLDVHILQDILDDLAPKIPRSSEFESATARQVVESASTAMKDWATILRCLESSPAEFPVIQAAMDDCLGLLSVHWEDVARWMSFFIQWASPSDVPPFLSLGCCVQIMRTIATNVDANIFKSQIASTLCTVDVLFNFLFLGDPHTPGRAGRIRLGHTLTCSIAHLYHLLSQHDVQKQSLTARLSSASLRQREAFVSSLVQRIQELPASPSDAEGLVSAAEDLAKFVGPTSFLFASGFKRDFERQKFVLNASKAIGRIAEAGVSHSVQDPLIWWYLMHCIRFMAELAAFPRWRKLSYRLIEGGIISSILYVFPRISHTDGSPKGLRELDRALTTILPFLTERGGLHAARVLGGIKSSPGGRRASWVFENIIEGTYASFDRAMVAFGGPRSVTVCCGLKVSSLFSPFVNARD
jgi:hypothetical protein